MRICNPGVAGEYIFAILSLPDKFVQSGRNPVHLNICDAIIAHWLCINTDGAARSRTNWMFWRRGTTYPPTLHTLGREFAIICNKIFYILQSMPCHGLMECFRKKNAYILNIFIAYISTKNLFKVILNHFVHLALIEGIFVYQSGVQILDRDQLCIRIHLVPLTDTVQCCIDMSMQIFTLAEMLI